MLRASDESELEVGDSSYRWSDSRNLGNSFTLVGKNTYAIGMESGKFEGRWHGIWSLPIKLADRVHFAVSDGSKVYFLYKYATEFVTKLSHVERTYRIPELGIEVKELMFIPENRQSVCWRFVVKKLNRLLEAGSADESSTERDLKRLRFLAECEFNLMWEVKQAGEQYKVRKEIVLYNEDNFSVIAKHYRHADWIGIFGANRQASRKYLGFDRFSYPASDQKLPSVDKPHFGSVLLEYEISTEEESSRIEAEEELAQYDDEARRMRNGSYEIDLCLTGGSLSYQEAYGEFNYAMVNFESLAIEKSMLYKNYLEHTVEILHPENALTRAFRWSKVNLHMLEHYQPGFGTGTFAGLPHFAIYFGRDMCWATFGLLSIGDFDGARENLNLLARFQAPANGEDMLREPYYRGEIPHEIRTEGTVYYYSADATPLFVVAARNYLDWTRDINFVKFIYNNIIRAIEWSIDADRDGDQFIEHGPEGFLIDTTWMDSYYRGKSALDVQAIFCRALLDGAHIASTLGDEARSQEWLEKGTRLKNLIMERYWNETLDFFHDTIEPSGEPNRSITVNSVVPVLLGLTNMETSYKVLSKIEGYEFMTEWGVRTRSKKDPDYDPRSYQKGGVWPFCTGWVALSEFRHGMFKEGLASAQRFVSALDMGSNYFKEVLYGDMPPMGQHPVQPTGCFIQAWSASMFLTSTVQGLFGITPRPSADPVAGLRIVPYIGDDWKELEIHNVRIGENKFDYSLSHENGSVRIKVLNHGPETANIETGFVLPGGASTARLLEGSSSVSKLEQLSQTKVSDYLKAIFTTKLNENEKGDYIFAIS